MRRFRITYLPALIWVFSLIMPSTAQAASYEVTAESEWTFTVSQTETVYIYGNSNAGCANFSTDPYLWLYNSSARLCTHARQFAFSPVSAK